MEVVIDGVRFVPCIRPRRKASLAELVREGRERKQESLDEAAGLTGMTKGHLWEIEKGNCSDPGLSKVIALVEHFGIDFDHISSPTKK